MGDPNDLDPSASTISSGDGAAIDPSRQAWNGTERYRVGRELARGGMGSIHEAEDLRLSRTVAVKQLLVGSGAHAKVRFEREALITAHLQHPAVVPVFDFGELPGRGPYYAMKLVEGVSLDRAIEKAGTLEARLALLPHVVTVVDAIAYAHSRGIVHRDLKPHNVLVGAFGETVVVDWGLAKEIGASDDSPTVDGSSPDGKLTQFGTVLGTPSYMPPEQAEGAVVDTRADVYALGAMLYHLLAGRRPYPDRNAARVLEEVLAQPPIPLLRSAPGLPIDLVTIVEKAMAREPSDRYATALEMAADLRRFQTGQLVGAHHYTAWQLLRRLVSKNPAAVALGAVVAIALLFAVARLVLQQERVRDARETKRVTDVEIGALETALADAHDSAELRGLEQRLEDAVRRARRAAEELAPAGALVARADDDLDLRVHAFLARMDADTYSIPRQFRSEVVINIDRARSGEALERIRQRKRSLWPIITRELNALGLPEELGYLAWVESRMDPSAENSFGSVGLWQFVPETAGAYGLHIDGAVDERADPARSSHAAAQLLADRFAEFGGDATLIAVMSYNLGESKTRALLHAIAMEKGSWRSGQRSYWHLYRMRRLPQEAMDYVPKLVAAALFDQSTP
jgi:soluble lytic murein transglycosylase-like protein